MSITPAVELDAIVDDITAILVDVIGDEFLLDVEVTMATTFSHDLELESIEFVAMAEKLQERYAGRVDFTAFLAGLVIDNLSSLYYSLANPVAQVGADAILYDQRGHGLSERPPSGYRIEDSVADLGTLLDALEVSGPVHLVGHSYGASVALRAALAEPARFASVVLIEPHCAESHDGGDWVEDVADMLTAAALSLEHNPVARNLSSTSERRKVRGVQATN